MSDETPTAVEQTCATLRTLADEILALKKEGKEPSSPDLKVCVSPFPSSLLSALRSSRRIYIYMQPPPVTLGF